MQENTAPVFNRAEPFHGFEAPTPRPMHMRVGEHGLLVPAWSPESAGFGGQSARASFAATSDPVQMGGLTPTGFIALKEANPDYEGSYLENWWAGWTGEPMPVTSFAENTAFTGEDGAQAYIDARFKDHQESLNFYSKEQMQALKNSKSAQDVEFKLRLFGRQNAALDRIKFHDAHSGTVDYITNKTLSAAVNYIAPDVVGNAVGLATGATALKAVSILGRASKTLTVMGNMAVGAAEGGAMGYLYEYNQTKFQNNLGNDLDEFDNSTVAWGIGLGTFAGLLSGVMVPGLDDNLTRAIAEETAGSPLGRLVDAGVTDPISLGARTRQESVLANRAARIIRTSGGEVREHSWIFGNRLAYTAFQTADEAVEWLETARPSADELKNITREIADRMLDDSFMRSAARSKFDPRTTQTKFQQTGEIPLGEKAAKELVKSVVGDVDLTKLRGDMDIIRSTGIMQRIPGVSKTFGSLAKSLGGFGARGRGVLENNMGDASYVFQMLNPVGIRNGDMANVRSTAPSMQAARASATNNLRKRTGLQKDLLKYNKEIKTAAVNGDDVVSIIADAMLDGSTSTVPEWAATIAAKLKATMDDYGNKAVRAGLIEKQEDYFPVLFNKTAVQTNGPEFKENFTKFLKKHFTKDDAELNRITVAKLKADGKWADDVNPEDLKYGQLEGDMKKAYDDALEDSLAEQAEATTLRLHGAEVESLLVNPEALNDATLLTKKGLRADSRKKKTLPSSIYLDDGMKPFLTQDINDMLRHMETDLFARTEFALGQAEVFGRAMELDEVIEILAKQAESDLKGLGPDAVTQRAQIKKLFDDARRAYDAEMGRLPADQSAFRGQFAEDLVNIGMNTVRAGAAGFWGIAAATMELPMALMRGSGFNPRELTDRFGDALRTTFNTEYRWDNLAATADAVDELRVNLRGMLENSAHEGQYLGMGGRERFVAPWLNIKDEWQSRDGINKLMGGLTGLTRAAADGMLAAGMMPAITRAGRVMVGRASERFVSRKLGAMRKLAAGMEGGVSDPKAFRALARKSGFRSAQEAAEINAAGLLDPRVLSFLEDLQSAGLLGRKGWDNARIYEYAQRKGKTADYDRFVNAQTEYITDQMNYAFANPNATSRVDVLNGNWVGQMFSMFMNFPAAFYQQRMIKVAQGDTISTGPAMFASYIGLEVLHRALRDMADPSSEKFLSPNAVLEEWQEDAGLRFWRSLSGGVPMTGLFPLGQLGESFVSGRPMSGNLTQAGISKLFNYIRSTGDYAQRGLEYMELLNQSKAQ